MRENRKHNQWGRGRYSNSSRLENFRLGWEEKSQAYIHCCGSGQPSKSSRSQEAKSKADKAPLPKVPKFVPPTINLDESPVDVEPVQTIHSIQSEPTPHTKTARKPPSSEPSDRPSNLVLDESYAWRTFKGIVTDNEVNECYNMSVKEFECSGIHDLFKVSFIRLGVFLNKFSK